jgi:hypothetical protein
MNELFLSFRTRDSSDSKEWTQTGHDILRKLGEGLERKGFTIDYDAGKDEPDWVFVAKRSEQSFGLAMSISNFTPCRWFVGLENQEHKNLDAPLMRQEVHPTIQKVIEAYPGISEVRWHTDHTTLRELRNS